MRSYGQYCPIARAEVLAERWTPIVVRNLILGCRTYSEIARGVPGMSRSLLTKRLRELERAGIIKVRPKPAERGFYYELTEAGQDLCATMDALAAWGARWMERKAEHTNPQVALWSWCTVSLRRDLLPDERVVVAFEFPDERANNRRYWMLVENRDAELCHFDWCDAMRAGAIRVIGPRGI